MIFSPRRFRKTMAASVAILLFGALSSQAADFTCSVPDENEAKVLALCENIRRSLRVRNSEWSPDICAGHIFRIGMIQAEKRRVSLQVRKQTQGTIRETVNDFSKTWPEPDSIACSDGIVDREFGEECDDGNQRNGDGCSSACIKE